MFDLLKLAVLACGFIAIYGLATGADLNSLFLDASNSVLPAFKEVAAGIVRFVTNLM